MEKMNCVKRSISLLVAMCMFGGCSLNVIAAQKYENAQDTYAKEMVGVYLSGTDYETLEGVSLSEAVNLYDLENMEVSISHFTTNLSSVFYMLQIMRVNFIPHGEMDRLKACKDW